MKTKVIVEIESPDDNSTTTLSIEECIEELLWDVGFKVLAIEVKEIKQMSMKKKYKKVWNGKNWVKEVK